jgi:gamma-glutamyl:cysteine ligase YbdK (ATP-grasp superfamily)
MSNPDTAVRLANAFRLYLSLLQTLSANSPFRTGTDSGKQLGRAQLPAIPAARQFRDFAEFCRVADHTA